MKTKIALVLVALLIVPSLALAQIETAASKKKQEDPAGAWVSTLVAKMAEKDETVVRSVDRAIVSMGEKALPALEKAAKAEGDAGERAKRLIEQIKNPRGRRGGRGGDRGDRGDRGESVPLAGDRRGRRVTLDGRRRHEVTVGHRGADLVDGCGLRSEPGRGRRFVGPVDVAGDVAAPGFVGFLGLLDVRRIPTDVGHVFGERPLLDGAVIVDELVVDGGHGPAGCIVAGRIIDADVDLLVGDVLFGEVTVEVVGGAGVCGVDVVGLAAGVPRRPRIRG